MRSRVRRDERGAFLLIFALCLTLILIIVAMTVDLGQARFSKRDEQQLADLASLSAGREMAGYGAMSGGTVVSRPRDACKAAMASIRMNSAGFDPTDAQIDAACSLLPVTSVGCNAEDVAPPATPTTPTNATVTDDPYAVTVRWPIPATEIKDPRFSGAGINDGSNQCQRLRVAVQRTDDTAFAGVIGVGSLTTSASAVIRSTLDNNNKVIPAFLLLERARCDALTNSANGVGSFGIQILGIPSTDQPGTIHVDTTANSGCNGNAANSVAVYGTPLSSGGPSIHLHPSPSGTEGQLFVVATSNAAKSVPDGINVEPQPGEVVSRAPVDEEFNSTANPAVTDLHSRARTALARTVTDGTIGDGWKRLDCNLNALDPTDTDAANWYVRCDNYTDTTGRINTVASTFGTTPNRIVFDGDLQVTNGAVIDFATTVSGDVAEVSIKGKFDTAGSLRFGPSVERIYVGGATYSLNQNNPAARVTSNGNLTIRSTSLPTLAADGSVATVCPTAETGVASRRAEFVVFGDDAPNFDSAGSMAMCNTTLYLAGDTRTSAYQAQQTTSGGNCTAELPCPKTSGNVADAGRFEFNGIVDWTAPNITSGPPPSPRVLEDLLFWSEGSGTSDVKSGAKVVTQGIFIAPSMNVEFRSPALGEPRNAQFIARRLELLQGTLYMLPNPNDSTPIPAPGNFAIIR